MKPPKGAFMEKVTERIDPSETARSCCCSPHSLTVFWELIAPFPGCSSHPTAWPFCKIMRVLGEGGEPGHMRGRQSVGAVSQMGVCKGVGRLIIPVGSTWLISYAY